MDLEAQIRELHASKKVSLTKAAEQLGMSRFSLKDIVDVMGLVWPKVPRGNGTYVIDGVKDTLAGHAVRYDTTIAVIRWRLQKKQPLGPPKYVKVTPEETRKFMLLRQEGKTAVAAAKEVGRPYATMRLAVKKFYPNGMTEINEKHRKQAANDRAERGISLTG